MFTICRAMPMVSDPGGSRFRISVNSLLKTSASKANEVANSEEEEDVSVVIVASPFPSSIGFVVQVDASTKVLAYSSILVSFSPSSSSTFFLINERMARARLLLLLPTRRIRSSSSSSSSSCCRRPRRGCLLSSPEECAFIWTVVVLVIFCCCRRRRQNVPPPRRRKTSLPSVVVVVVAPRGSPFLYRACHSTDTTRLVLVVAKTIVAVVSFCLQRRL